MNYNAVLYSGTNLSFDGYVVKTLKEVHHGIFPCMVAMLVVEMSCAFCIGNSVTGLHKKVLV